jgi:cytochrome c oxidase cbb3-type subunit 3
MGVSLYPVVSLLIFTIFFAGVMIYSARMDRKKVDAMKHLPFND